MYTDLLVITGNCLYKSSLLYHYVILEELVPCSILLVLCRSTACSAQCSIHSLIIDLAAFIALDTEECLYIKYSYYLHKAGGTTIKWRSQCNGDSLFTD